jgi:hypothetical protein
MNEQPGESQSQVDKHEKVFHTISQLTRSLMESQDQVVELGSLGITKELVFILLQQAFSNSNLMEFGINPSSTPREIFNLIKHEYLVYLIVQSLTRELGENIKAIKNFEEIFGKNTDPTKIEIRILSQDVNSQIQEDIYIQEINNILDQFFNKAGIVRFLLNFEQQRGQKITIDYSQTGYVGFDLIKEEVSNILSNKFLTI